MIVWGRKPCGHTDEVPGLYHVSTWFWHLGFLPVVPLDSRVVTQETAKEGPAGIPIRLHWRSVLLGWARGWLLPAAAVLALPVVVAAEVPDPWEPLLLTAALALVLWAVVMFAPTLRWSSFRRAQDLVSGLGLYSEDRARLEVAFGHLEDARATEGLVANRTGMPEATEYVGALRRALARMRFDFVGPPRQETG